MPATHQIPKGARTRSTPDWFIPQLSSAGLLLNNVLAQYAQISLFNDATDGRYLYLYGLCIAYGNNGLNCYQNSPVNGSPVGPGFSVKGDEAAKPGTIYQYYSAAPPPEYLNYLTFSAIDLQGASEFLPTTFFPGFPLAVIPPGMAFVINQVETIAGYFSVTFWWLALKP